MGETLLIPLHGRATLTREGSGLIADPKAVEMVEAIALGYGNVAAVVHEVTAAVEAAHPVT